MESNLVIIEEDSTEEDFDIGPLCTVLDETIKDKARHTLPSILAIGFTTEDTLHIGVFAKCPIAYRTQFGPLDAPLVSAFSVPASQFPLRSKVKDNRQVQLPSESNYLYYDTFNEKLCNWMCLVRPAGNFEEQNLVAHFVRDDVFFTTTRAIEDEEELKVWYAPKYASFMGTKIRTPTPQGDNSIEEALTAVRPHQFLKSTKSPSYDYCEGDHGLDVRSVPPKKRGWKRASQQINKSNDKPEELQSPPHEPELNNVVQFASSVNANPALKSPATNQQPLTEPPPSLQNKVFCCSECGKLFSKKYTLKMHLTTHSKTFDYLCHACGKGFKRSDKLKDHIKRIHGSLKVNVKAPAKNPPRFVPRLPPKDVEKFLYKCIRCSVGFIRRGMLVNHMLKQHPDMDIDTIPELSIPIFKDDVSFSCLYCNKNYKSNSKRKRHIEKHHPGQSVPPDSRKSKHAKDKHGISSKGLITIKPVTCPYCPSQYTSRSKMVKHVQAKHGEKSVELHVRKKNIKSGQIHKPNDTFPPKDDLIHSIADPLSESNPITNKVDGNSSLDQHNTTDYNNVENLITFWNTTGDPSTQSHSMSDISAPQSVCHYIGTQHVDNNPTLVEVSTTQSYPSPVQSNFVSTQPELRFIEESPASNRVQDTNKLSTVEELKPYHPDRPSAVPNYIQQPSNPFASTLPTRSHGLDKTKYTRQLPLTYSRGRKQLLLPFYNDRLGFQYSAPARVEKHASNYIANVVVSCCNSSPQETIRDNQYTPLSSALSKQPPNSQAETSIPPLTYQDVNWM